MQSIFTQHQLMQPESKREIEQIRGRIEYRQCRVLDSSLPPEHLSSPWCGIKTVGLAVSYRVVKQKKCELDYRYFISSAELTASRLASAAHERWGIENQHHRLLDVSTDEDNCQIYRGHGATNLASLRLMALHMLRAELCKALSVPRGTLT